ncbi:MAG: ribonuclease P protein component [Burkholderiales bacterium]
MTRPAAGFSFSRASRLAGRHAFASVFAYKCSVAGRFFQVYAKPNNRADSRLGITVNKRFVPQATARNLCKRLAREAFRVNGSALKGVDLVVRARSVVLSASSAQARAEILELMKRARQLCCDEADSAPLR